MLKIIILTLNEILIDCVIILKENENLKKENDYWEIVDNNEVNVNSNNSLTENEDSNEALDENKNKGSNESLPVEIPLSSSLEKLNINNLNKKDIGRMPFSAPVKSNKEQNLKSFGLSNTSLEKLNRRNSYDQYVIRLNEPLPDGSPHKIASIRPLKNVAILSNNYTTTIEFKKPQSKDDDSRMLKKFLEGSFGKKDGEKEEEVEEEEEDHSPDYSNRIEKFKMIGKSNSSFNVLMENVDIKCNNNIDRFPRNASLESLESVEFKDDESQNNNNGSWFSSISKSFQSWMGGQKNSNDYEKYFTSTDNNGNTQVMPVKTIMYVYNLDFEQASSIHNYVLNHLPKFQYSKTSSFPIFMETPKENNNEPNINNTLELIYKNRSINPVITSDLALKLQAQLPMNLRGITKWTMQYSLASSLNHKESSNNENSDANNNLIDLIDASQNNGGPCLIIIQDDNNYVINFY